MIIKFEVTEEDIKKGIKGDCVVCPIARALLRELPEGSELISERRFQILHANSILYQDKTWDREISEWIGRFDSGQEVFPFKGQIEFQEVELENYPLDMEITLERAASKAFLSKIGKIKTEKKAKASRENGKLGGRPRKIK